MQMKQGFFYDGSTWINQFSYLSSIDFIVCEFTASNSLLSRYIVTTNTLPANFHLIVEHQIV